MSLDNLSRRAFLASAGTVIATLTVPLASGPVAALAEDAASGEGAAGGSDDKGADTGKIVVVHTNDVHCALTSSSGKLGYAKLADYVSSQRATYGEGNVTLVDAGDNVQGGVDGSLTNGECPAQVIGATGYDAMTLGNHEFDYGMDQLMSLVGLEKSHIVCCNFMDTRKNERVFDAYRAIDYDVDGAKVQVAYVGVSTPSTLTSSTPTHFQDGDGNYIYGFCGDSSGEALYSAIQAAVDEARDNGADYVVLLGHLGILGSVERWRSETVIANTTGIDVLVDGHSHETYTTTRKNKNGQDVVLVQTGTQFKAIGRVQIDPFSGTATAEVTATGVAAELINEWDGSDEEVAALVEKLEAELDEVKKKRIGSSAVELLAVGDGTPDKRPIRMRETNMGDFVADSVLYFARSKGQNPDIAFTNAGGIRKDIEVGDITYGDLVATQPYGNQIAVLPVSGQHLLDMLEIAYSMIPVGSGRFFQVSEGVELVVRIDIDTPVVMSDDQSTVKKIEGERRVCSAKINGVAIDPAGTYTVAGAEFNLTKGGDKMPIPENATDAVLIGIDVDGLIYYIEKCLGGTVGAGYEAQDGAGRIRIVDHWEPEEDDSGSGEGGGIDDGDTGGADGDNSGADGGPDNGSGDAAKTGRGKLPATGDASADVLPIAAVAAAAAMGAATLAK